MQQDSKFEHAELVDAFLERAIDLGDGKQPSQADVLAVVRLSGELGILAVEAKVDEPFGRTVDEWLSDPRGNQESRTDRVQKLCGILGLAIERAGPLRYQLIHRTVSAVLEAKRYCAREVAVVVQSFCPKRSWFANYAAFAAALGMDRVELNMMTTSIECDGVILRLGWVAELVEGPFERLNTPHTVPTLTELGRTRLSKSFFMREMLYWEVAMVHGLNNAPENPQLAIEAGTRLCEELLEPLQDHWGRIAIRSAYRSPEVNAFCNAMQRKNKAGYTCSSNEQNYAAHIWDYRDAAGKMGTMACIIVPSFWDEHQSPADWQILARWIHENLPYSTLTFFRNIGPSTLGGMKHPQS